MGSYQVNLGGGKTQTVYTYTKGDTTYSTTDKSVYLANTSSSKSSSSSSSSKSSSSSSKPKTTTTTTTTPAVTTPLPPITTKPVDQLTQYEQSQLFGTTTKGGITTVNAPPVGYTPIQTSTGGTGGGSTGVVVLYNKGTPVIDVKSGMLLETGQGAINISGGTTKGGVSIPVTLPTTTSAGVTTVQSDVGLKTLNTGIEYANTPAVQQQVQDLISSGAVQQSVISPIKPTPELTQPVFQTPTFITPVVPTTPQINIASLPDIKTFVPDVSATTKVVGENLLSLTTPAGALMPTFNFLQTKEQELGQQAFQGNTILDKTGGALGSFVVGVGTGAVGLGVAILNPIDTAKSLYGAVTNPVQTVKGLYEQATTNPYGFTGEMVGGALLTEGLGKVLSIGSKSTTLVQTGTKELEIAKSVSKTKKIVPQIGEDIKFTEVKGVGLTTDIQTPTTLFEDVKIQTPEKNVGGIKIPATNKQFIFDVGTQDTAVGISKNELFAVGKTPSGKTYALQFEPIKSPITDVSAVKIVDTDVSGKIVAGYKPSLLVSQEDKVSYLLTEAQQQPVTLKAVLKGTISEEGKAIAVAKGQVRAGSTKTGVLSRIEQTNIPAPPEFAEQGLQRYVTISDSLSVSGASAKSMSTATITAEDILKAQSRRSITGKSVTQELSKIELGEGKTITKLGDVTESGYRKIDTGFKILKEEPSTSALARTEMSATESQKLLQQIEQKQVMLSEQALKESLQKQLATKGLTRSISEPVTSIEKVPLGTISIKSFEEVTTYPKTTPTVPYISMGGKATTNSYVVSPNEFTIPSVPVSVGGKTVQQTSLSLGTLNQPSTQSPYDSVFNPTPTSKTSTFGGNVFTNLNLNQPSVTGQTSPTAGLSSGLFSGVSISQKPSTGTSTSSGLFSGVGLNISPMSGQGLFSGLSLSQQQGLTQRQMQRQQQSQQYRQAQMQKTRLSMKMGGLKPTLTVPKLPFLELPKTSRLLTGTSRGKGKRTGKRKKFAPIPFADYLSVTQTAQRTGGYATQPRITRKAGVKYLRAVQRGQLRFPTFEQMKGRRY